MDWLIYKNKTNKGNENTYNCLLCQQKISDKDAVAIQTPYGITYICKTCAVARGIISPQELNTVSNIEIKTPKEIYEELNKVVVGQEHAKKVLSIEVYKHLLRIKNKDMLNKKKKKLTKNNILLTGPSGTGKTLLAKTIAEIVNIPFAMGDATTLTPAGYVGEDVESLIFALLHNCDFNVKRAEIGIIFIDEIDKIARRSTSTLTTRDVSGEGVQQALLKMIEGQIVRVPIDGLKKHPLQRMVEVDTSDILFIAGGAFVGIEEIVKERLKKERNLETGIGFETNLQSAITFDESYLRRNITMADLHQYGMIPEFLGRFPVISNLEPLSVEQLVEILKLENGILDEYKTFFEMQNKTLIVDDSVLERIATLAIKKQIGARGLRSIIEEMLFDIMFESPSENIEQYVITEDFFDNYINEKQVIQEVAKY